MKNSIRIFILLVVSAILLNACVVPSLGANENEAVNSNQNESTEMEENANDSSSIEFEGVIESMDGGTWIVAGNIIFVNPAVIGETSFTVGDSIRVSGALNDDGSVTALELEWLASANANANEANENDNNSNDANSNDDNSNSGNLNFNSNTNDSNSNDDNDNDDD